MQFKRIKNNLNLNERLKIPLIKDLKGKINKSKFSLKNAVKFYFQKVYFFQVKF